MGKGAAVDVPAGEAPMSSARSFAPRAAPRQYAGSVAEPARPESEPELVVLVAPTRDERARFIAQLDPAAPVLMVPTMEAAQALLETRHRSADVPTAPRDDLDERAAVASGHLSGSHRPRPAQTGPEHGMRIHEDRQVVGFGTVEVSLTTLEFALLRLLLREPERVWRFAELVQHVWGTDHVGDTSQVHAVVKRLRAKLIRQRAPVVIEAVRGVGFRALRPAPRPAN